MAKTVCPVTRDRFLSKPRELTLVLMQGDEPIAKVRLKGRQFSTRSLGWNASQRVDVDVDGEACGAQLGLNLTLIGSKELE